ncbi:MAG: SDR family oxidoreductase [Burkholderiaceae bacterium]
MGRLNGKIAAVTGAAIGGIGEATVRRFLAEGAHVVFCDVDVARGQALSAALSGEGGNCHFEEADISDPEQAEHFIQAAHQRHGRLDILVNNAAIRNYQDITEADPASWDRVLGVNLMGMVNCARPAVRHMREQHAGVIVNLASVRSLVSGPRCIQYDTSKAAILGLTRGLANDHAADGIRVMAVAPGPIYTDFHRRRVASMGREEAEFVAEFGADTMLKRPGTPNEIANAILFVASDEASFMTGTCIYVDGGQTGL